MADKVSQLRSACVARHWERVGELAKQTTQDTLNTILSPDGWRALHFASAAGSEDAVKTLLKNGADSTVVAKAGSTPLHLAAWEGREAAVAVLIEGGAPVDARTAAGRTPLHFASHRGHAHIARRLVGAGADVNASERDGRTPLFFAAREGSPHAVRAILDAGADPTRKDNKGTTAAQAAVKAGHDDVLAIVEAAIKSSEASQPNNEPVINERRAQRSSSRWGSFSRAASDLTSMFTGSSSAVRSVDEEGRIKDDSEQKSTVTRGEMYAVVGAGVLVSALIPVVRSAVRDGGS